jgi:hypothetical protein
MGQVDFGARTHFYGRHGKITIARFSSLLTKVQKQSIFGSRMRTCSLSEAKSSLGRLADDALEGHPTVISRGGKLLILRAYDPPDPDEFDALIAEGMQSQHFPITDSVWKGIRTRGKKLARKLRKDR